MKPTFLVLLLTLSVSAKETTNAKCQGKLTAFDAVNGGYHFVLEGDDADAKYENNLLPNDSKPVALLRQACAKRAIARGIAITNACTGAISFTPLPAGYQFKVASQQGAQWDIDDIVLHDEDPAIQELRVVCDNALKNAEIHTPTQSINDRKSMPTDGTAVNVRVKKFDRAR